MFRTNENSQAKLKEVEWIVFYHYDDQQLLLHLKMKDNFANKTMV